MHALATSPRSPQTTSQPMLAAVKVKPKLLVFPRNSELRITTDPHGPSSDQTPFTNTTISPAGPIEKGLKVYDKDNIPTIKWVTTTSLMGHLLIGFQQFGVSQERGHQCIK